MGKTFAHIRSPETRDKIEQRQKRQRIMGALNYGGLNTSDFDDVTLADLDGLDHIANASREG